MKKQDGDSVWYEGYSIDLFKELAKILKFTYEFYPTPDGYYGAKTENGTWNGLVGELIGKVDYFVLKIYTQKNVIPGLRLEKRALDDPWEGTTWINFCWLCAAGLSESLAHYSLIFNFFQIQFFLYLLHYFKSLL